MKKTCNSCVSDGAFGRRYDDPEWHENCRTCGDDLRNWIWKGHADKTKHSYRIRTSGNATTIEKVGK